MYHPPSFPIGERPNKKRGKMRMKEDIPFIRAVGKRLRGKAAKGAN